MQTIYYKKEPQITIIPSSVITETTLNWIQDLALYICINACTAISSEIAYRLQPSLAFARSTCSAWTQYTFKFYLSAKY